MQELAIILKCTQYTSEVNPETPYKTQKEVGGNIFVFIYTYHPWNHEHQDVHVFGLLKQYGYFHLRWYNDKKYEQYENLKRKTHSFELRRT